MGDGEEVRAALMTRKCFAARSLEGVLGASEGDDGARKMSPRYPVMKEEGSVRMAHRTTVLQWVLKPTKMMQQTAAS